MSAAPRRPFVGAPTYEFHVADDNSVVCEGRYPFSVGTMKDAEWATLIADLLNLAVRSG